MRRLFFILVAVFCVNIAGYGQSNEIIYVKFTSTNDLVNGKVYKQINQIGEIDAEKSISYILEDKDKGYSVRFSHHRHKREEIIKSRPFAPNHDFMTVTHIKSDEIEGRIIDLDKLTTDWKKEDAWKFVQDLRLARIYFIDTREAQDSVYLIRQVKLISSNSPHTDVFILDDEQAKIFKEQYGDDLKKRNLVDDILDSQRRKNKSRQ